MRTDGMRPGLDGSTIVHRTERHLGAEVDGETVTLDVETGEYYVLDAVGADIWSRLEEPATIDQLCDTLDVAYSGDPAVIRADVVVFLEEALRIGLVGVG